MAAKTKARKEDLLLHKSHGCTPGWIFGAIRQSEHDYDDAEFDVWATMNGILQYLDGDISQIELKQLTTAKDGFAKWMFENAKEKGLSSVAKAPKKHFCSVCNTKPMAGFLDLPGELRNHIYNFVGANNYEYHTDDFLSTNDLEKTNFMQIVAYGSICCNKIPPIALLCRRTWYEDNVMTIFHNNHPLFVTIDELAFWIDKVGIVPVMAHGNVRSLLHCADGVPDEPLWTDTMDLIRLIKLHPCLGEKFLGYSNGTDLLSLGGDNSEGLADTEIDDIVRRKFYDAWRGESKNGKYIIDGRVLVEGEDLNTEIESNQEMCEEEWEDEEYWKNVEGLGKEAEAQKAKVLGASEDLTSSTNDLQSKTAAAQDQLDGERDGIDLDMVEYRREYPCLEKDWE
ncbi:hypothetical protein EJ08DRAFT_719392 [Tothia fuscella]|uniref:Uncharacterized protein n=1 Tax=Tothia fuscella TaxID=1048955 RepID=A0A9P4NNX4_9PEZI|nr:hypothetical protein EJ08DRAFT_719392 [Tothia fuscella]